MIKDKIFEQLFIFEMANNHMGDVAHGLKIIREFHQVSKRYSFNFGFKLQYRDIDAFIHPDYKQRQDIKYVKRFTETRLREEELKLLKDEIQKLGFLSICTPFDEKSVDLIEKHDFNIIKIGSCSFTDWPLLERIARTKLPIILSTGGISIDEIDKVVSFFTHRDKNICLMHCVGEYPTAKENLHLNQIDFFRDRYPDITIGYSTHEQPDNYDAIKIAISKGAKVFERHVGIQTDKYSLNNYSSQPEQIDKWLKSAEETYLMCGAERQRRTISDRERTDLRGLQRGVFAARDIKTGEKISYQDIFMAMPNTQGQIIANELSKYMEIYAKKIIKAKEAIMFQDVDVVNLREKVVKIVNDIRKILIDSKINLSNKLELEISHHYGIENYYKYGAAIITCVNREYCKKLIIVLPEQQHPSHFHEKKEETFHVLYGDILLKLGEDEKKYNAGDIVVIERGVRHGFMSRSGAIFEEVSTTHFKEDSFYDDKEIMNNKNRKTEMTFWADWLTKPVV